MPCTFLNKKGEDIERPLSQLNFVFLPAFSLSRFIFCHNKLCRCAKRDTWWTQTSSGIRLPGAPLERASHSSSSCCVLAPVDDGCHQKSEHVSVSYLAAHCLFFCRGILELVSRRCVGGVNVVYLDRGPTPTSDLLFAFRTVFWHFLSNNGPCSKTMPFGISHKSNQICSCRAFT